VQASLAAILYASDLLLAVPARPRRLHAFVRRGSHGESKRGCALAPVGSFVCQVFGSFQRTRKRAKFSDFLQDRFRLYERRSLHVNIYFNNIFQHF